MSKLNRYMSACALFLLWAITTASLPAQTFNTLYSFNKTNGAFPWAPLVQATDGTFYGTTQIGGNTACTSGCGTVFKMTSSGRVTTLRFNGANGSAPFGGLVLGTNGDLYGATLSGGSGTACPHGSCGTIFKVTLTGVLTTLHNFNFADGAGPHGTLILATDGNFYGTTSYGGPSNAGSIFKMTPSGTLTTLHFFNFSPDGCCAKSGLVQGADGNFYGTAWSGGVNNYGTVFMITPDGIFTVLHAFDNMDGSLPFAGLIQGINGDFYGTTEEGGAYAYGTVFEITSTGSLTTLHSFNVTDGDTPISPLVQANDGNLYGTTSYDGTHPNFGTVYKITPGGVLTTLHNFASTDGSYPYAGLVQSTSGILYGATFAGGSSTACSYGCGTAFSLSVGLNPFVETLPTSGKTGAMVTILGTNLTGATSVSFNGRAATFVVISPSQISASVPAGTTTGTVQVTTPGKILKSNIFFHVTN